MEGCLRAPEDASRVLRFAMTWDGAALCLRCENTALDEPQAGRTSKREAGEHGFGLPSMRAVAKRYGGSVAVERAPGSFVVRCVLRIRPR